jgi:catechol 2,3-dioxygenase-like lactoylglutathione lyase family enzyme
MFRRIDHVEIVPSDFDATLSFYTDTLGFSLRERRTLDKPPIKEIAYVVLGDSVIEMINIDRPAPAPAEKWAAGYHGVAVEVENMSDAVEYLKSRGVQMAVEPVDLGNSLRGEIRDPDGLTIELRQWFK